MADNAIELQDDHAAELTSLNAQMEQLAVDGDWQQISVLLTRRNALLQKVDARFRGEALLAARRSTERIRRVAEAARRDVANKLSRLQRGREATDSYQAHA